MVEHKRSTSLLVKYELHVKLPNFIYRTHKKVLLIQFRSAVKHNKICVSITLLNRLKNELKNEHDHTFWHSQNIFLDVSKQNEINSKTLPLHVT